MLNGKGAIKMYHFILLYLKLCSNQYKICSTCSSINDTSSDLNLLTLSFIIHATFNYQNYSLNSKNEIFLENQFYFNFLFCFMNIFLFEPTNTRFLLIEKKTAAIK